MISRLSSKIRYRNNSKIVPLPLGEGGAAEREPDRAKHEEKRRVRVEFLHDSRGFTLIEVLVSLSIMALITGIAFSGLSAGIDSWERGTRKIQELDRRVSVQRLLNRQLPLAIKGQFEGSNTTLEFVSSYSLANGPGDPVTVKYSFESGNLTYSEAPLTKYTAEYGEAAATQSLGAFTEVRFSYLGRDALLNRAWVNEWKSDSPPPVVRFEINKDILIVPIMNRQ
jgi:prepilin-type N-terminal cleavage/methylation domain-containing protein